MLKRSQRVTPAILGSMVSLAVLTACGNDDVDANVFETVEQCAASGQYTQAECQQYFDEAKAADAASSPAYANQADCEDEFGSGRCAQGPETDVVHHYHSYHPISTAILIGASRAYEPSALAVITFLITWGCMGVIQLLGRGRRGSISASAY